jgi:hypothetical protein
LFLNKQRGSYAIAQPKGYCCFFAVGLGTSKSDQIYGSRDSVPDIARPITSLRSGFNVTQIDPSPVRSESNGPDSTERNGTPRSNHDRTLTIQRHKGHSPQPKRAARRRYPSAAAPSPAKADSERQCTSVQPVRFYVLREQ